MQIFPPATGRKGNAFRVFRKHYHINCKIFRLRRASNSARLPVNEKLYKVLYTQIKRYSYENWFQDCLTKCELKRKKKSAGEKNIPIFDKISKWKKKKRCFNLNFHKNCKHKHEKNRGWKIRARNLKIKKCWWQKRFFRRTKLKMRKLFFQWSNLIINKKKLKIQHFLGKRKKKKL